MTNAKTLFTYSVLYAIVIIINVFILSRIPYDSVGFTIVLVLVWLLSMVCLILMCIFVFQPEHREIEETKTCVEEWSDCDSVTADSP